MPVYSQWGSARLFSYKHAKFTIFFFWKTCPHENTYSWTVYQPCTFSTPGGYSTIFEEAPGGIGPTRV